jgi:hypothetical protein
MLSRYPIPVGPDMKLKNETWLRQIHERHYKNQKYLEGEKGDEVPPQGLESESISTDRLAKEIEQVMVPLIGKDEDLLKLYELKKLDQAIRDLMVFKLTHGDK